MWCYSFPLLENMKCRLRWVPQSLTKRNSSAVVVAILFSCEICFFIFIIITTLVWTMLKSIAPLPFLMTALLNNLTSILLFLWGGYSHPARLHYQFDTNAMTDPYFCRFFIFNYFASCSPAVVLSCICYCLDEWSRFCAATSLTQRIQLTTKVVMD